MYRILRASGEVRECRRLAMSTCAAEVDALFRVEPKPWFAVGGLAVRLYIARPRRLP